MARAQTMHAPPSDDRSARCGAPEGQGQRYPHRPPVPSEPCYSSTDLRSGGCVEHLVAELTPHPAEHFTVLATGLDFLHMAGSTEHRIDLDNVFDSPGPS